MAVTQWMEAGSAETQNFTFWDSTATGAGSGTLSSVATKVSNSVRSILSSVTSVNNSAATALKASILADAGRRISIYMNYSGTPTMSFGGSAADFLWAVDNAQTQQYFGLGIDTNNKLCIIIDGVSTPLATSSLALPQNIDLRICIVYTITSTTNFSISVYVNGSLFVSATNAQGSLPAIGSQALSIGWGLFNSPGSAMTANFAHIFVDNGTSGDTGDIHVTAKRPFSNGSSVQFTTQIGSGGSGYGSGHTPQVNERPLSTTNGWSISQTTKQTEEYNIESKAVGDNDLTGATIIDYMGWIYSSVNSTSNSPVHHIIVNGVATTITESTTNTLFTKIAGSTTYPAGTGTDIGIDAQYTTTAHLTRLFECGILLAYIPAPVGKGVSISQAVNRAATY